jgi:hypothetical protein
MALARCEKCGRPSGRMGNVYTGPARLPVGHPLSGVICGTTGCDEPGLVWLLDREQAQYKTGTRIFGLTGNINHTKLAVQ